MAVNLLYVSINLTCYCWNLLWSLPWIERPIAVSPKILHNATACREESNSTSHYEAMLSSISYYVMFGLYSTFCNILRLLSNNRHEYMICCIGGASCDSPKMKCPVSNRFNLHPNSPSVSSLCSHLNGWWFSCPYSLHRDASSKKSNGTHPYRFQLVTNSRDPEKACTKIECLLFNKCNAGLYPTDDSGSRRIEMVSIFQSLWQPHQPSLLMKSLVQFLNTHLLH